MTYFTYSSYKLFWFKELPAHRRLADRWVAALAIEEELLDKTSKIRDAKSLKLLRYLYDGGMTVLAGMLGRLMRTRRLYADGRVLLNFAQCESLQDALAMALGIWNATVPDYRPVDIRAILKTFGIR